MFLCVNFYELLTLNSKNVRTIRGNKHWTLVTFSNFCQRS